jgi:hypothetical protein
LLFLLIIYRKKHEFLNYLIPTITM